MRFKKKIMENINFSSTFFIVEVWDWLSFAKMVSLMKYYKIPKWILQKPNDILCKSKETRDLNKISTSTIKNVDEKLIFLHIFFWIALEFYALQDVFIGFRVKFPAAKRPTNNCKILQML